MFHLPPFCVYRCGLEAHQKPRLLLFACEAGSLVGFRAVRHGLQIESIRWGAEGRAAVGEA